MAYTTQDVRLRDSLISHIAAQIDQGFNPRWMLKYHYSNPYERGWRVIEGATRWGYKIPGDQSIWNSVGVDKSITSRRNDVIRVSADSRVIRNHLIKALWGVNDLRKHDQSLSPMIFFHEKGRLGLQYHTHILLGGVPEALNSAAAIDNTWKSLVLPKVRCLSKANTLHIRDIDSPKRAIRYLTKEITSIEPVIDWETSIMPMQRVSQ